MDMLTLSLGCYETDRSRPILDGRVRLPGIQLEREPGEPRDLFRRALQERAFAITELSMSSHIVTMARGDAPYIGVPVFPSRAFRHESIYIRTDRGIRGPADLAGRRIGVPEYQQTAALWVRGMLRDYYGVDTAGIAWRNGGLESPGQGERVPLSLPPGLDVRPIGSDETLNALLADGSLDAIVSPRAPSCFQERSAPVDRLWPHSRAEEERYFDETGFFPIMHCMAVRRDVAEAHPWLPRALFLAFSEAKALALADLAPSNVLRVSLPWITAEATAQTARMGGDPWPYGFARNRAEIETMIGYAVKDGLSASAILPEALFHPSTLNL
ncbi:ABC transporter substrate-binding protein [Roseomonas xinghualingensis]|uniref:ABC transporter substrate-binding protein n=1 Tax=Roseomonas xinghualingensis TaxID=2986475 RepID=UPI0021F0DDB5|nr:ABC transporter substrate-binding protein [Roseomonas sp. SXEYE001]MCV4209797.1 ABC transporter substrate-binding protein [Roseomonas sp. SXEYE001]